MLPIKKVLDISNQLPQSSEHDQKVASIILNSLSEYDNDLNNVFLTFNHKVGTKYSGEIMSFEYFKKHYHNSDEIINIINNGITNSNTPDIKPIKVLDLADDYSYPEDSMKAIAEMIVKSLPEFNNDLNQINLAFPYSVGTMTNSEVIKFSYLSQNFNRFHSLHTKIKEILPQRNINFSFDRDTGFINETESFGVSYINHTLNSLSQDKQQREQFLEEVKLAFQELILQLPSNISDIKGLKLQQYGSEQEFTARPLLTLVFRLNSPQIVDFVFSQYPQLKEYYDIESNYYQQDNQQHRLVKNKYNFVAQQLNSFSYELKSQYEYIFYRHGLIDKNTPDIDFQNVYQAIFKTAIYQNDIEFIRTELKNPDNLNTLLVHKNEDLNYRERFDFYEYPTRLSSNLEINKILKEKGFPFFSYLFDGETENKAIENHEVETLFKSIVNKDNSSSLELSKLDIIPLFSGHHTTNFYDKLKNFCTLFPEFENTEIISKYANSILNFIEVDNLPLLFKEFPSIDYTGVDVFSHLHSKHNTPISTYASAIEVGVDPRICGKFIERIVKAREDGLKLLKALNKEGIVVIKNPDYVFHIYNNNPTKNFTTYFDKCSDDIFSKYTASGEIVWWGVESQEQIKSKLYRINDVTQNAKDGRSLFHYFAHKEHSHTKQINLANLVNVIFGSQFNPDNQSFDLSYVYPNGNNLLHEILTFSIFKKSLNTSSLSVLDNYSKHDLALQFSQKNNNGETPLEMMINKYKNDSKIMFNFDSTLSGIFNIFKDRIDYSQICKDGESLANKIKPYLDEKNQIELEDIYLQQTIPNNIQLPIKNIVKF